MEKKKNPKTIEFEFPQEIVHQIQSFMDEREAARTTLVSKSWYGAWSTRPNLSFDQRKLRRIRFPRYARKTLQRYEDLNLNIQTFHLWMHEVDPALARELILKAIKLGAIDLTIDINSFEGFVLPDEVLESQTLARLSVDGDGVAVVDLRKKPLTSSNLKSLTLYGTETKGDFSYLCRRFPLLEELTMEGLFNPCPFYSCTTKLHELKFLELVGLLINDNFSKSELWLQFPCLKTLVIWNCHFRLKAEGEEDVIRIRSPSLERLTIKFRGRFAKAKLEFDVPNIRRFELKGYDDVPRLASLKASSRLWESDIRITCTSCIGVSWLRSLKHFVKLLSPSRVSLVLKRANAVGVGVGLFSYTCSGEFDDERFSSAIAGIPECFILRNVEQFQHLSSLP